MSVSLNPLSAYLRIADDVAMATTRRADMFIDLKDDLRENGPNVG
jgi:hypothetical protein